MRIKKFHEFINEEEQEDLQQREEVNPALDSSAQVSNLIQELQRNYINYPSIAAMKELSVTFLEEKRTWPAFGETAKLDTETESNSSLWMKFSKNGEVYELTIDFLIGYMGVENFDSAVTDYFPDEVENARLGVALEKLRIKRIAVKSDFLMFNETKILPDLAKTALGFMLGVLKPEFDLIADETLVIRQL